MQHSKGAVLRSKALSAKNWPKIGLRPIGLTKRPGLPGKRGHIKRRATKRYGKMAVTLREVALRAGVSRSAVSRAYTPGASVSAKARAAIAKAADDLGYSPSALAKGLSTGQTHLIGLVSNNFHNPVFLEVFDQFTRGLQERGLRPLLVNLSGGMDQAAAVEMLRRYSVDGVILASSTLPAEFAERLRAANLPVVQSFGRWSPAPVADVVGVDNRACGRLAAQALLDRGYRRVAFLGGPEAASSTQDRLAGFMEVLGAALGAQVSCSFAGAYSHDAGRAEMQRLLALAPPAEAYFCGDDVLSIGALGALADAGLKVPQDVGILGLNDMEMAAWPSINLTTIRQPIAQIIEASIEMVVQGVKDSTHSARAQLFECSVVERGTLRPRV